ncbi:MAG: zf-HC2 domain-containing protein [Bacteroidales bacterium]
MNCNTAKKYLYLFREGELSETEKSRLAAHLKNCYRCRMLAEEISEFACELDELCISGPQLKNQERFTDDIMEKIVHTKKNHFHGSVIFLRTPAIKVAASVLIILQVALFAYQRHYINHSLVRLSVGNQINQSQNDVRQTLNASCIEETRIILTEIFSDEEIPFRKGALAFTKNLSPREIELYSVQICAYSYDIQNITDKQQKKLFLSNIINNELPIKL